VTAQENLARVIQNAEEARGGFPSLEDVADAVLAHLTSDEAVSRAATRLNELHAPLLGMTPGVAFEPWEFDMARAAILAALGVESLPLDPEPWFLATSLSAGLRASHPGIVGWSFDPRPGYEQRREFYEKGAE
jgi:hypothetical protein